MRVTCAIAAAALLACAAPASADVLVPADPPPHAGAAGVTAAGNLIAYAREHDALAFEGATRVGIAGVGPGVAAAADGTAILAAATSRGLVARVRRPGQPLAAPIRLGGPAGAYRLAAAPGGWTAAAWLSRRTYRVEAAVIDLGGTINRAELDRPGAATDVLSLPQVGIDAGGRATVAWSRWRYVDFAGSPQRIRAARADRGNWTAAGDVATGAAGLGDDPDRAQVALAVAPGGRSLLAWAGARGIQASVDGGAPIALAAARAPGAPTAALADDGSAVVAYTEAAGILAVDRGQGAWGAPHPLGRNQPGEPRDIQLASTIAADGRALVAWPARGAFIAAGRAGGAWAPAVSASSPLRAVFDPPVVALDGAGEPFAVWLESEQTTFRARARGARLVPDAIAPPPDATAPVLITRLPRTVRIARSGAFSFRIPVRCSEACDVRVSVTDANGEGPGFDLRERTLAAGAQAAIRLSPAWSDERMFVKQAHPTRLKISVEAADRAGNVATATRTARVQR